MSFASGRTMCLGLRQFTKGTARSLQFSTRHMNKRWLCSKSDKSTKGQKKEDNAGSSSGGAALVEKVSQITQDASARLHQQASAILLASFDKVKDFASAFDDVLGISEVRDAQSNVRTAEDEFMTTRKRVQTAKKELEFMHNRLADVRRRLDRTPRDDERYLALATEEHRILLEEKKLKVDFEEMENIERDQFAVLSGIVRDSHEKERARAERTKYWSVVGSVVGAALGIIGSTLMNYVRLKEIKGAVKGTGQSLMEKSDEIRDVIAAQDSALTKHTTELSAAIASRNQEMTASLADLRDAVDTYALSASIGSDIGTIEAGISLKTLTSQLRELVQLQLASQREKAEENLGHSNFEFENLLEKLEAKQSELRNTCSEILLRLEDLQKYSQYEETFSKSADDAEPLPSIESGLNGEFKRQIEDATWWSKFGAATSITIGISSLSVVLYEILAR